MEKETWFPKKSDKTNYIELLGWHVQLCYFLVPIADIFLPKLKDWSVIKLSYHTSPQLVKRMSLGT